MKFKPALFFIFIVASMTSNQFAYAEDEELLNPLNSLNLTIDYDNNQISLAQNSTQTKSLINTVIKTKITTDDWIKTKPIIEEKHTPNFNYSLSSNQDLTFSNKITFAWNLSDVFSVNLNVYDNQLLTDFDAENSNQFSYNKGSNKSFSKIASNAISDNQFAANRGIRGYTFGIASELGLGKNYKLDLNVDYGQLDGAHLMGFQNNEITTTSFGVGIRKSKFGASVNTDLYMEDNMDFMDNTRLGIEFDWYFTDKTTISLGTKQRINTTQLNSSNSLDNLTGTVQYIKFQHNL